MKFEYNGQRYKIWFKYEVDRSHNLKLGDRRETLCFIDEDDEPVTNLTCGSAVCARSDVFKKDVGRRVSLTKALPYKTDDYLTPSQHKVKNLFGSDWDKIRAFRKAVWTCYNNRAENKKLVAVL